VGKKSDEVTIGAREKKSFALHLVVEDRKDFEVGRGGANLLKATIWTTYHRNDGGQARGGARTIHVWGHFRAVGQDTKHQGLLCRALLRVSVDSKRFEVLQTPCCQPLTKGPKSTNGTKKEQGTFQKGGGVLCHLEERTKSSRKRSSLTRKPEIDR